MREMSYLKMYHSRFQLNSDKNLPVMVWIHGGGFIFGSSSFEADLYGPGYILDRNVILVTINYRLGVMGKPV